MTVTEASATVAEDSPHGARWLDMIRSQGLVAILVALVVVFSTTSPYFLTQQNLIAIATSSVALGLMAIPQTYLIVSGGMDVSVGAVVGLSGVVVGLTVSSGRSVWVGAALALLAGIFVGAVNATLVVALTISPLISTLGSLSIFTGLAYMVSGGRTLIVSDSGFAAIARAHWGQVPACIVVLVVLFAMATFVEKKTPFGRSLYAIGGNAVAARLVGIRTRTIPAALYVASGASAAIAGLFVTAQLGAASPAVGDTFMLSVVTAVILGGASLQGGIGSVLGTVVAVGILGVLQSGFTLLQFSSSTQRMAQGLALILAVLLDQLTRRLRSRRSA